ncbi:hypothetical protein [Streptomyces sp. NBC_01760]|uniref:hypothetical protein n=1 Tax=Streptomyces sp. NBC_01760 TaxID=2975931 RepID=UPI002DDA339E|nr:hypothetical protein [Streptomyces sp. NBC_01760]WSC72225.1 hypothetical protein OG807_29165 [Streptomyces sp. NBC_01760]
MDALKIRLVEQTDPDPNEANPAWYPVDDFLPEDAAAIRAGKLQRYTVEIIRTDDDGAVTVLGDSHNHVSRPGIAGIYGSPYAIPGIAEEIIKIANDELTNAAGLEIGDHVVWTGYRPDGAGRLHEVLEIPKDDEGFARGTVRLRQLDGVAGHTKRALSVTDVSKEIGPRKPNQGRDRGGIGESFRRREGGGFLVYAGDYADQVVMSARMAGLETSGWVCRSIDEFGDDAWVSGMDRAGAIRAHGRKYPNKGLSC